MLNLTACKGFKDRVLMPFDLVFPIFKILWKVNLWGFKAI